ncbi:MAG: hypothetical protein LVQ75_03955 [Candidatus Babeliales bacterium]|jgi:chromosome segregation ATPase
MNKKIVFSIMLLLSTISTIFYAAEGSVTKVLTGKELDEELARLAAIRDEETKHLNELESILNSQIQRLKSAIKALEDKIGHKVVKSELFKQAKSELEETTKAREKELKEIEAQLKALKAFKTERETFYASKTQAQKAQIRQIEEEIRDIAAAIQGCQSACSEQENAAENARKAFLSAAHQLNSTKEKRASIKPLNAQRLLAHLGRFVTGGNGDP